MKLEHLMKILFKSQLRINMLSGISSTFINLVVTSMSYPLYLHYLGYELFGTWIVLFTVINFAQLSTLGIGPSVTKLVAESYGKRDIDNIEIYFNTASIALFIIGFIAAGTIILLKYKIVSAFNLYGVSANYALKFLPIMGGLTIYVFFIQIISATVAGIGRIDLSNYCETLGRLISFSVSLVFLYLGYGLTSLVIGNVISYFFIHIGLHIVLKRHVNIHYISPKLFDLRILKNLIGLGGGVFGGALISMMLNPFNKLILSRYVNISAVSVYEIAFNGSMQLRSLFEAGFRSIAPEVSSSSSVLNQDFDTRIHTILSKSMGLIIKYAIPVWIVAIVFCEPFLKLWLGSQYMPGLPIVFQAMLFGTFFSLLGVPFFYTYLGLGNSRLIFISFVIQSFFNASTIVFLLVSGMKLGAFHIALATAIGMLSSSFYLIYFRNTIFSRKAENERH